MNKPETTPPTYFHHIRDGTPRPAPPLLALRDGTGHASLQNVGKEAAKLGPVRGWSKTYAKDRLNGQEWDLSDRQVSAGSPEIAAAN